MKTINNKKSSSFANMTASEAQAYIELGVSNYAKKLSKQLNSKRTISAPVFEGTGVRCSKNILGTEDGVKSQYSTRFLGGHKMKKGKRDIAIPLDPVTLKKFTMDAKARNLTQRFLLASIVINRFPAYFNGDKSKGELSKITNPNLFATGMHAHTDYMKRSGMARMQSFKGRRPILMIHLDGIYATKFYHVLQDLCRDNHMAMGCLLGVLLEAEYKNANVSGKIHRIVAETEASNAMDYLNMKSSTIDSAFDMAVKNKTMVDTSKKDAVQFYQAIAKQVKRISQRPMKLMSTALGVDRINKRAIVDRETQIAILDNQVVNR